MSEFNEKFLPDFDGWAKMYEKWHEQMAKSLWTHGNSEECREAVHEAFLKAMNLSDRLRHKEQLTAKTEGCWYGFLRNQAKGILSNGHRSAKRFEPIKEYGIAEGSLNEDDWGDVDDLETFATKPAVYGKDLCWLKDAIRKTVREICRDAGVSDRNMHAFELFVLDELDGGIVVRAIPSVKNTNNLYQIKKRIMDLLVGSAARFEDIFCELMAA